MLQLQRSLVGVCVLCLFVSCSADRHRETAGVSGFSAAVGGRAGAQSIADPAFLEQYAATFRFRLGTPTAITCVPGGKHVLFLRSGPRSFVQDLYEFDIETGQERVVLTAEQILAGGEEQLTAEELARRERMRMASRGIASYSLSKDGARILVPLSGRLFVIERATGAQRELKSEAGYPIDPRFSPDGAMIACVREGEVYVTDVASGEERKITSGAGGTIENGLAEFVAQEEMDRREGYWWSPDGNFIAYQRTDTEGMQVFRIADPVNPEKEAVEWPYPRAGQANAKVALGIASTRNGSIQPVWVQWDREAYPYLARVDWPEHGPMTILVQNRRQTEQRLLEVEPPTGGTRAMLVERDEAWLNLHGVPRWVDRSSFLWISQKGGDARPEMRDAEWDHQVQLAFGNLLDSAEHFVELVGVAEQEHFALVTVATNPSERHVYKIGFFHVRHAPARPFPQVLTTEPGVHSAAMSSDGLCWVDIFGGLDGKRSWTVRTADGKPLGVLKSMCEKPSFRENVEITSVESDNSNRAYSAALIRPRNFSQGIKYPVILSVYGGPGHQQVTAATHTMLLDQWFADHGFIVVRVDGRGTPGRGREWERAVKGDLGTIPLDDHVDALQALGAKYPELDLSRVGVYGWSFGGYFSAMGAMRRPDIFRAGVAGAPVADWRDYDTHYTERFMGLPEENKEGYDRASVLTYCKDLKVPLLIIHGTSDDNVYFMHSLKMCDALFRAGKHYEFLALPGFTHMVPDPVVTKSLYGRIAEFFIKHVRDIDGE